MESAPRWTATGRGAHAHGDPQSSSFEASISTRSLYAALKQSCMRWRTEQYIGHSGKHESWPCSIWNYPRCMEQAVFDTWEPKIWRYSVAASVVRVGVTCLLIADGAVVSSQEHEVVEVVEMSASPQWPIQWLLTLFTFLVGCWWLWIVQSTSAAQTSWYTD